MIEAVTTNDSLDGVVRAYPGQKGEPMTMRIALVICAALALTVGVATASGGNGGNSANAKTCQKGGWMLHTTASGASFVNQSDCVSYAAGGGALVAKGKSQLDCESFGSAYSTDP